MFASLFACLFAAAAAAAASFCPLLFPPFVRFVPYALRAKDVQVVIPTVNALYNIQLFFFEVDINRTFNRFKLKIMTDNQMEGETCWVGFRVIFNTPNAMDPNCLNEFNSFDYCCGA